MGNRECLQCGADISHKKSTARFCGDNCRQTFRYREDLEASRARRRNEHFQTLYGITLEERDRMFAEQDAKCLICEIQMTLESHKTNSANVDHCHTTGETLGLLCSSCNTALGKFGENPVILAKAIQYLTETGKVPTR